jgi:hypothetical protein
MTKRFLYRYLTLTSYFCFLFLYSCEYDNNDMNFHKLAPPSKNIVAKLDLANISEGETIYIYSPTSLAYTLNISSGTIVSKEFFLDNQFLYSYYDEGIYLSPDYAPENAASTLTVKIKVTSCTGSLAELLGGEKNEFKFTYKVKFVNPTVNLNIRQRVRDSHMELYWDKPQVEGAEVESYTIYNYDNFGAVISSKIANPDQTSFVDKNYVYGSRTYRIITKYKLNRLPQKEDFYTIKYENITSNTFTTSSSESFKLKIKWNNPNNLAAKYVLKWNNSLINISEGASETSVLRPPFPMQSDQYFELYILPVDANFDSYASYPKVTNYFKENYFGETLEPNKSPIRFAADLKNGYILAMRPNDNNFGFRAYDKENLNIISNKFLGYTAPYYTGTFTTSPNTGQVAIHYRSSNSNDAYIQVYSDYTLNSSLGTYSTDHFPNYYLTEDDKLLIMNTDHYYSRIFDVKTSLLLKNHTENAGNYFSVISANGQYIINYMNPPSAAWFKLYKYEFGNLTLIKAVTNSRTKAIAFNPKTQNQVVMQTYDNMFSICEVPNLNKIATIEGEFVCFDPFTGNVLYEDKEFANNSRLNVLNSTYDKTIYSIVVRNYYYYYCWLLNNHLILRDYYVNITK